MAEVKTHKNQKHKVESTQNLGGAPVGNKNAAKSAQLSAMLRSALEANDRSKLRNGLEQLTNAFNDGERWAIEFVFDRLEGKASQTLDANINGSLDMSINVKFG
jgi:hypothetical protein